MPTEPYDLESFLLRNKWDLLSITLVLLCIPGTRDATMAIVLMTPICALFIGAAGFLFSRPGIIVAALLSLVLLAGTAVMSIINFFWPL